MSTIIKTDDLRFSYAVTGTGFLSRWIYEYSGRN